MNDFVPSTSPEEMLKDPWVSRAILTEVLDWLRTHAADRPESDQRALARAAGVASGLFAAEFPEKYGGWSLPELVVADLREEAAASGLPYSRHILSCPDGPSRIVLCGTPEQRERWLRPMIEGRMRRCLAMTEESGGSDVSAMSTTATRAPGGWVLNGRKFMISNAETADAAVVLANVVGEPVAGPTFFIFTTDVPGWRIVRRLPGMEPGYDPYEVELDGIEVGEEAVLGGPGQIGGANGMAIEWLPYGRVSLAARAIGLARWALGVARAHASQRRIAGGRLSDKQYIREFIVRSDVKIEASRALIRQAARALDEGGIAVREAAIAKLHATESACEVIDDAMQTLGGRGWLQEYGLERAYREARVFRMVDGASELLKETIFHIPGGE